MAVTKSKRKFRSPALQYIYNRFIGHDTKLAEEFEEEVINADISFGRFMTLARRQG